MVEQSDVGELTLEDGDACGSPSASRTTRPSRAAAPAVSGRTALRRPRPPRPPSSTARKIESPMVGTFYRASGPNTPAFVEVGDRIEVGQTLCLLEAMKLFNELQSDHSGVIRRILVENAEPVEFGQPLFELELPDATG